MRTSAVHKRTFRTFLLLVFTGFLLNGCAGIDKKLSRNEAQKINKVKVARSECPLLLKETADSNAAALTGILFGAIGGAFRGGTCYKMMEDNGREVQQNCSLPDYSKLVMDQFVKRAAQELSSWPKMEVENNPVEKDFKYSSGYLLLLRVTLLKLKNGDGFVAVSTARLVDPGNETVWKKKHEYESNKFNRTCRLKELEANKGKLLHEEYHFAAKEAVTTFINDLNAPE